MIATERVPWNWETYSKEPNNWQVYNRAGVKILHVYMNCSKYTDDDSSKLMYFYYNEEDRLGSNTTTLHGTYYTDRSLTSLDIVEMECIEPEEKVKPEPHVYFQHTPELHNIFWNKVHKSLTVAGPYDMVPNAIKDAARVEKLSSDHIHLATITIESHPQVLEVMKAKGLVKESK
jgi:hypothetical protein